MSKGYSGHFSDTIGARPSIDFYIGPTGRTMLSIHSGWLGVNRRDRMLAKAKNPKVRNIVNQLYRTHSMVGDGSTASALKFEKATGLLLSPGGHQKKAKDMLICLTKTLKNDSLSNSDQKLARYLIRKLAKALGGNNR